MQTDREKHGLKGLVKSVHAETSQFEEQDGQIVEKLWLSHTTTFNQEGWLVEQIHRNPGGSEWRTVIDYDGSSKLLVTRVYDASGRPSSEARFLYDDEGRRVAEQSITPDGRVSTPTTYVYDSGGRRIKIQEFDNPAEADVFIGIEGTNISVSAGEAKRVEIRYDGQGEVAEVEVFNALGVLVSRTEITRDALGNPLEETQYVGDAPPFDPCASDSCSADELRTLTEEQKATLAAEMTRLFSPGTPMSKHTYRYDAEGRLVESNLTMMGVEVIRQTYTYDDAGNKSAEVSYGEDGKFAGKAIFTREYDRHGNWTQELVSMRSTGEAEHEHGSSTPDRVTRRVMTYW